MCWSNEQSFENPLLNSCQCDGSVRYIHYECLKFWLKQKMARKETETEQGCIVAYSWRQFECEICKEAYPYVFKANGRKYRLIDEIEEDLPADKSRPYLVLQSLTFEKNTNRMVQIIKPNLEAELSPGEHLQVFKMGRGHESEIRICDISVSRCHTLVKYNSITGQFQTT